MLSPDSVDFCIELLAQHHNRRNFCCGNDRLDRYLHSVASQDLQRNIAIPYIVVDQEHQKIIGYYTLSMSGIDLSALPADIAKKLPKYPIVGVNLIGRLAVEHDYRGAGWGKLLIMDALYRSLGVSRASAAFAVVVDAIDDDAMRFYQRFEFQSFPDRPERLFRTMASIAQSFSLLSSADD